MIKNKEISTWKTFFRLWSMISPFKKVLIIAIIALVVNSASDTIMLSLLKPLLDEGFGKSNFSILVWMPIKVLGLILLKGMSSFISNYCISWVSGKVVMNMRRKLFSHIMDMPVTFFDQQSTSTLLSRITYDSEQMASSSSNVLIIIIREIASIFGLFIMMFYYSWQLSVVLIFITPLISFFIKLISKRFRIVSKKIQNTMGQVAKSADQMLKGHKEILIFGGKKIESEKFNNISNRIRKQGMKMVAAYSAFDPIVQIIASFSLIFVLYVASFPAIMATLTAGTITVIFSSMIALMRPLKSLTNINVQLQKGIAACQILFSILDLQTEQDRGTIEVDRVKGDITFDKVTFYYPGKKNPSLYRINFSVPSGKMIALVGRSGSGKSTIANLLTRFYDVQHGQILLDGTDLRSYKLSNLRRQIALVSQNVHLFNDTIANNISYACEKDYTREQIENAAKMAHAMDFIDRMEHGLDTIIGENGILLSGGQRQRIAIARALLRDCPILILDEATETLDLESEQIIQKVLNKLQKYKTSLVIAHRLSTIKKANEILVVENGKIVERGSHKKLMSMKGKYAKLYELQYSK